MLAEKYAQEIDRILAKYPPDQKRSAVMPLLYLAQREAGFYTLYYEKPAGKYRLQVCTDLPCALRGADEFLENLCENIGIQVGETTPDGLVTLERVMCLAACDRAPMFQIHAPDGLTYHENQTVESTKAVIEELRSREAQS
jgi:NADH-quinone oxidoreductase subunit E